MSDPLVRVALIYNDEEFSQAVLAEAICEHASMKGLVVELVPRSDISFWSRRSHRVLSTADVYHWLSPTPWTIYGTRYSEPRSVVSIHHLDEGEIWPCSMRPARWRATHSKNASDRIAQICGRAPEIVIPYGFDGAKFSYCDDVERRKARQLLGLSIDDFVVGCFGNAAQKYKNIPLFVASLIEIALDRSISVLVVGQGWSHYVDQIRAAGVRVIHAPVMSFGEMRSRYAALDVYVCTSSVEGGPLPVLEALACSTPVVTTSVGHAPVLVDAGVSNGFVVASDPRAVADGVRRVFDRSEHGRADQKIAASVRPWCWTNIGPSYHALYLQLARECGESRSRLLPDFALTGRMVRHSASMASLRVRRTLLSFGRLVGRNSRRTH